MDRIRRVFIANKTRKLTVCARATVADTFWLRLRGLLGTQELGPGAGMLLLPSSSIHTFGMQFAIDAVSLDRELCVLGIFENIQPGKMRFMPRKTHSVLELKSGRAKDCQLEVGDRLVLCERNRG